MLDAYWASKFLPRWLRKRVLSTPDDFVNGCYLFPDDFVNGCYLPKKTLSTGAVYQDDCVKVCYIFQDDLVNVSSTKMISSTGTIYPRWLRQRVLSTQDDIVNGWSSTGSFYPRWHRQRVISIKMIFVNGWYPPNNFVNGCYLTKMSSSKGAIYPRRLRQRVLYILRWLRHRVFSTLNNFVNGWPRWLGE